MGPRGHKESGMTERLHFHYIHELFPLIDGLGQPGEFTKLTVDSQDPLPQCHFLHFRKDCRGDTCPFCSVPQFCVIGGVMGSPSV